MPQPTQKLVVIPAKKLIQQVVAAYPQAQQGEVILAAQRLLHDPARRKQRAVFPALVELFENAEDDIVGFVGRWVDRRIIAGDPITKIRVDVRRLKVLFKRIAKALGGSADLQPIVDELKPRKWTPLGSRPTDEALRERVKALPYPRTVLRRLYGCSGFQATREVLEELLVIKREAEPDVARLVAVLEATEITDVQAQVVAPLLAITSRD